MPLPGWLTRWRALYRISKGRHYLQQTGWLRSAQTGYPVTPDNQPLPWLVYACTSFLEPRLTPQMNVFEYGSGYGTLWWAQHVNHIDAVENNPHWFNTIAPLCPPHATVHLVLDNKAAYAAAATQAAQPPYDIIIIDGPKRQACLAACMPALTEQGVIILDDSERPELKRAINKLLQTGFKRLDFIGLAPIYANVKQTTIFYRPQNILNI